MLSHEWTYAFRSLWRSPRFTVPAGLTLALGIGANAAIFTILNAVYLRPLPFPDAGRLVSLQDRDQRTGAPAAVTPADYGRWRANPLFSSVGAWGWDVVTLGGGPWPERVQVQRIAGDYLRALGVQPVRGRSFLPAEERGGECAVLVSMRLWRNWFGAGADPADKPLTVDGAPCRAVGIMPERFLPPLSASTRVDAWMPLRVETLPIGRRSLSVMARLAPNVSLAQAQSSGALAVPLKQRVAGKPNQALLALAGAVGFLLLIACINVATLVSARSVGQRREMAIRAALGAGRGRLTVHLLCQALLLSALGGLAGLLAAWWSMDAVIALAHGALPRLDEARVDWRLLAFTAALSITAGILFGLAPAIGLSRSSLRPELNVRAGRQVLRNVQVAAEVALAFVLLAGAGLLIRSFHAIMAVDLGFRTEHLLSANFALPPSRYKTPEAHVQFLEDVLDRVRALPGVVSATATLGVPMRGSAGGDFEIFGRSLPPDVRPGAEFRPADTEYFDTLGIRLARGRTFTELDADGAPPVALVNERLAQNYFGAEDPIGKQVRMVTKDRQFPWMTVVGVVRDTRHVGPLRGALAEIYFPYRQFRSTGLQPRALVVRSAGEPERLLASLQRAVASVDKDQPLVAVSTMEANLREFIAPQRFDTILMGVFAAIGLILSALGIFGVMSYRMSQRTQEIGVRIALGATGSAILRMVLGEGLRITAAGLVVGWVAALALTRYLRSILFEVKPGDPATLIAVSLLALATAAAACYLPARRASRMEVTAALREE